MAMINLKGMRWKIILPIIAIANLYVAQAQTCELYNQALSSDANIYSVSCITLAPGFSTNGYLFSASIGLQYEYTMNPTTSKNYVQKIIPLIPFQDDISSTGTHNSLQLSESVTYLDGFGRPTQAIAINASPAGNDIVQPIVYDAYGRSSKSYLPYTLKVMGERGGYRADAVTEQGNFYYNGTPNGPASTQKPFAEVKYDNSPLNRVIETSSPGETWQLGTNHTNRYNTVPYIITGVPMWKVSGNTATYSETYSTTSGVSTLIVNTYTDEDNKTVKEYVNGSGQVVFKEAGSFSNKLNTQYVYDDFGRLRYIITPEASDLSLTSLHPTDANVKKYCYYYEYDDLGRKIIGQNPGTGDATASGQVWMVYDKLDRPVLTQDGNQRAKSPQEWSFVKYDIYSRPIITGIFTSSSDRATLQDTYNSATSLFETRSTDPTTGYTNNVYPTTNITQYLSVIYYDDYSAKPASGFDYSTAGITGFTDNEFANFTATASSKTLGKATVNKTWVLNPATGMNSTLFSVIYYDDKGRPIQTTSSNHANGRERISNKYNFSNQLVASVYEHLVDNSNLFTASSIIMGQRFTYDMAGRPLQEHHQITGYSEVQVCEYAYNELGQAVQIKYHKANGNDFIQFVDYSYNIRGWLKSINDPLLNNDENDLFGAQYFYNESSADAALPDYTSQYGGNISAVKWRYSNETYAQYYAYLYDNVNQLTKANYASADNLSSAKYDVTGLGTNNTIQYNKNGNMLNLKRNDENGNLMHNFEYTYNGNQLSSLSRGGMVGAYTYDFNGNMTFDEYNRIGITYNIFNLPQQMNGYENRVTNFYYSGNGSKVCVENISPTASRTHYLGSFVYEGVGGSETLNFIGTSFGRIVPVSGGGYQYEYAIADKTGNTRVRYRDNGSGVAIILEKDDYYPHGSLSKRVITEGSNQYLFNGKELQSNNSLNLYDYGARYYDPVIGRWVSQDPMNQFASPYNALGNNPINMIDPTGMYGYNSSYQNNWDYMKIWGTEAQKAYDQAKGMGLSEETAMLMANTAIPGRSGKSSSTDGVHYKNGRYYNNKGKEVSWADVYRSISSDLTEIIYLGRATRNADGTLTSDENGRVLVIGEFPKAQDVLDATNSGGNWNFNPTVDYGFSVTGSIADILGVAAARTVAELGQGVKGVSAVAKIGSATGTIGLAMGLAVAGYEYKTKQANTHTIVDLGVTALGMGLVAAGTIVASPAIIVGTLAGGAIWGFYSACGGSKYIDNLSNNWGKTVIYGND